MSDRVLTRSWNEYELKQKLAKMPVLPDYRRLMQIRSILLDGRLANESFDSLIDIILRVPLDNSPKEKEIFVDHLREVLVDLRLSGELTRYVVRLLRALEAQT